MATLNDELNMGYLGRKVPASSHGKHLQVHMGNINVQLAQFTMHWTMISSTLLL